MACWIVFAAIAIFVTTVGRPDPATAAKRMPGAVLDPAFGRDGLLPLRAASAELETPVFAISPNGDLILRGGADLRLLTPNGGPATIYGGHGSLVPPQPERGEFRPSAVVVDPQGRLLVVGTSYSTEVTEFKDPLGYSHEVKPASIRAIRYLPDGTLDPSFGTGGIVETDLGLPPPRLGEGEPTLTQPTVEAIGVAVDPQGGIVITGGARTGFGGSCTHDIFEQAPVSAGFVTRLAEDGSLDRSFGTEGVFGGRDLNENPLHSEGIGKPVIAPDGTINYLSTYPDSCDPRLGLAQLTADGRTRTAFGNAGMIRGFFTSFAATPGRSVVALAGEGWSGREPYKARVIKIRPEGSLDQSFGQGGKTMVKLGHGFANELGSVTLDRKGRILLAGALGNRNGRWMVLIRLSASGRQESTFGRNDRVTRAFPKLVDIGSVAESYTGASLDPTGRLVVLHRYSTPKGSAPVLARYLLSG